MVSHQGILLKGLQARVCGDARFGTNHHDNRLRSLAKPSWLPLAGGPGQSASDVVRRPTVATWGRGWRLAAATPQGVCLSLFKFPGILQSTVAKRDAGIPSCQSFGSVVYRKDQSSGPGRGQRQHASREAIILQLQETTSVILVTQIDFNYISSRRFAVNTAYCPGNVANRFFPQYVTFLHYHLTKLHLTTCRLSIIRILGQSQRTNTDAE